MTRLTLCALALATVKGCAQIHTEVAAMGVALCNEGEANG
jgi:hypothetical protein